MDFDDLMLHPLTLFREHPDRLRAYQQRFSFVLVDEFQDTNRAQYELIRLLGAHGNVCAVGDDDQSIYGWRGADVRNMQDFLTDFPGAKLVRLEENYRSTQIVLDAANGVIAENTRPDRQDADDPPQRRRDGHRCSRRPTSGTRPSGWCASCRRRSAAGDWRYGEMAVLYRTNSQSPRAGRGVPPGRRAVPAGRRDQLLRAARGQGPAGLPAAGRQPVGRRGVPPRGRRAAARPRRDAASACWPGGARSGASRCSRPRAIADRVTDLRPNVREAFRTFAGFIDGLRRARRRRCRRPTCWSSSSARSTTRPCSTPKGPEGADRWENVRELVASAAELVGGGAGGRRVGHSARAVPGRGRAALGRRDGRRQRRGRDAHDAAHRQGPRVAGGGAHRSRAWALSARAGRRAAGWAGGGAAALLRRPHPGQGQALSHLGAGAPPRRRAAAGHPVALPQGAPARHRRGAADDVALGAGLDRGGSGGRRRMAGQGALDAHSRRHRRGHARRAGRRRPPSRGVAGRAALRQRRAGAPSAVRQRHDPGAHRHRPRPQGRRWPSTTRKWA